VVLHRRSAAGLQLSLSFSNPDLNLKNADFVDSIMWKVFNWFAPQSKTATEVGWWLVYWNFEKLDKIKKSHINAAAEIVMLQLYFWHYL
jgi:hypothetical protein